MLTAACVNLLILLFLIGYTVRIEFHNRPAIDGFGVQVAGVVLAFVVTFVAFLFS